ncbi:asialoglycoprotein receptor 1 isoform X2 [Silurus meridionalis]|uniref:asialoglycoprotein receptor 1 isoform X2 n=1 Tax=Silurus meridionalis TaxID=175797 RepID=UPI001EEAD834|nr:asialoglycoprotein receptor 1 isoform X2 [Silurus meridionalis]
MRDTSETHDDEHDNFDTRDDTAFWRKGSFSVIPSFNGSFSFTGCSRWCVCMFTVLAIFLLAIIISISLNKTQVDRRLSAVESDMKNLSQSLVSHTNKVQQLEKQGADAVRSVNGLRLSLNSLQTQAQDFLTEVNNIKESVTQLKCHFDTLQNNTQQQCCPMDWQLFSSHCYYFSTYGKSWNEARDTCVNMKAELLILKNKEEKGFVIKNTKPLFYWLGLSDERTGEWEWLDGTLYQMDKRDWMPGQPDNWHLHGLGGGEDCAHFHSDGRYNDDHCSRNYRFICKSLAYRV